MKLKLLIAILAVLFITGCLGNGKLEVVDFNYPPTFNTMTGRVVSMNMVIKNIGSKDCIINRIYSRQFWNQDNPGLSGMYSKDLNLILSPNQEYGISLSPYLWDSDYVQSKQKSFTMVIEVDNPDDCVLEERMVSGMMDIKVEQSPLVELPKGSSTVVDPRP